MMMGRKLLLVVTTFQAGLFPFSAKHGWAYWLPYPPVWGLRKPFYRLVAPLAGQLYPLDWSSACPASFATRRCRAQIGEAELARNSQITAEARGLTLSRPSPVWLEDPRADSQPSLAAGKIDGARPDIIPKNSPLEFRGVGRATSGKEKKINNFWLICTLLQHLLFLHYIYKKESGDYSRSTVNCRMAPTYPVSTSTNFPLHKTTSLPLIWKIRP